MEREHTFYLDINMGSLCQKLVYFCEVPLRASRPKFRDHLPLHE